jgi:hypothetical protein
VNGVTGGDTVHGLITANGQYTAPQNVPQPPTVTVSAISQAETSRVGSASVTITLQPPPVSVSVTPTATTVTPSQSAQFTATVSNSSNTAVTWSLAGGGCAGSTCGTLNSPTANPVTYTAPAAPVPGPVTLKATSQADATKSASASVTITAPPPVSVSVAPTAANVTAGQSAQFTATVSNSSNTAVTWSLSGDGCAGNSCGTLSSQTGNPVTYTAPGTVPAPPKVTITATSQADNTKSGIATATVEAATNGFRGVLTAQYDNSRTGQNSNETKLTATNVNATQFGKVFSYPVDGHIYAQPLYVPNVQVPGLGPRNVVYVATQRDSVYAFDADFRTSTPLWKVSFINPPLTTTVTNAETHSEDIVPEIGITGTPVIDPASGTLYVVAKTKEMGPPCSVANPCYAQRLHALDIATGAEKAGSPVLIQASVPGTGEGTDGTGRIAFNALRQNQRPGLLLYGGVVYVTWAGYSDVNPYHGWMIGYDARTLQMVAAFNATPDAWGAGIWQSGGGPSVDANGNVYLVTGNGRFNASPPCPTCMDFGDSVLKLSTSGGRLSVADYFTPYNQATLDVQNWDLSGGSPMLIPDQVGTPYPHLLVTGGKEGKLYLLNRDNMGKFNAARDQIVQSLVISQNAIYCSPAFWQNNVYVTSNWESLKQYKLSGGLLSSSPIAQTSATFAYRGATPTISSNGSADGIVWILETGQTRQGGPAILHAYDANDISRELYNSAQVGSRDRAGPAVRFTIPTAANGRVYIGTQTELNAYGLLP